MCCGPCVSERGASSAELCLRAYQRNCLTEVQVVAIVLYLLILLVPNGPGFESPSASYQLCVLHQVKLIRWLLLYDKPSHSLLA